MSAVDLCRDCGAEVVLVPVQAGDPPTASVSIWGVPVAFERLMVALGGGGYGLTRHYCRDFRAWHQPADQRDVNTLDVTDGWRPRQLPVAA